MIVSVDKARAYLGTEIDTNELADRLLALELSVRKFTNNNFQNRNIRAIANISVGSIQWPCKYLQVGDTIQISNSMYNDGIYTITEKTEYLIKVDGSIYDESQVLVTKVEYPADVQMGVIGILRWQLKNESQNYDPDAEKDVQSETISRHSVTYAKDSTEEDIDVEFGVPKKYTSFLKLYMKARF